MSDVVLNYDLVEKSFEKYAKTDTFFFFYENLFNEAPQWKPLFERNIPKQSETIWLTVLLVENIRDAEVLKSVLEPLGEKHKGYGAIEQHYPMWKRIAQYFKTVLRGCMGSTNRRSLDHYLWGGG